MILKQLLKVFLPAVVNLGLFCALASRCCICLLFRLLQRNVEHGLVFLALFCLFYQLDSKLLLSFEIVKSDPVYLIFVCVSG